MHLFFYLPQVSWDYSLKWNRLSSNLSRSMFAVLCGPFGEKRSQSISHLVALRIERVWL